MGQHIDKLIRAKTGLKGRKNQDKRHRINQKINKLFIRCKNLINEAHKKVRKWLTNEQEGYVYSYFLVIPNGCQIRKKKRKLNSKTVREMDSLGT